jgi:hypothetical protein
MYGEGVLFLLTTKGIGLPQAIGLSLSEQSRIISLPEGHRYKLKKF